MPTTRRDTRRIDLASRRALSELAGRTVWNFSALPAGRDAADGVMDRLRWTRADGVTAAWIELAADEPTRSLADVMAEDLVFLYDHPAARLAEPARERGAHVVCLLGAAHGWEPPDAAIDAYVMAWTRRVVAMMPAPGLMSLKEVERRTYEDLGWGCLLADIVHSDREERVGGRLHPRPTVAAR